MKRPDDRWANALWQKPEALRRETRWWWISAVLVGAGLIAFALTPRGLFNRYIGFGMHEATVVKVCRDGTFVTRINEHYFVVRPDHERGWPAASADVCGLIAD